MAAVKAGLAKDGVIRFALPLILVAFVALELALLLTNQPAWWDEGIYVGMGKSLFSNDSAGMWEWFRPVALPVVAGVGWLVGFGLAQLRLLVVLSALATIYLTYLIGRRVFGDKTGLLAAALLAFTPLFAGHAFLFSTDIPSTFLALLAVYILTKAISNARVFYAGVLTGLAFVTRFPQALLAIVVVVTLFAKLFSKNGKAAKNGRMEDLMFAAVFVASALLAVMPYFAFNQMTCVNCGSVLAPLSEAQAIVSGYEWRYAWGYGYYAAELLAQNFFLVFSLVALPACLLAWKKDYRKFLVALAFLAFFAYFTILGHKEVRYALVFLPYLALLSASGLLSVAEGLRKRIRFVDGKVILNCSIAVLVVAYAVFASATVLAGGFDFSQSSKATALHAVFEQAQRVPTNVPVYSTTAAVSAYADNKLVVFSAAPSYARQVWERENKEMVFVNINTCDLYCPPDGVECVAEWRAFVAEVAGASDTALHVVDDAGCEYYVFKPR